MRLHVDAFSIDHLEYVRVRIGLDGGTSSRSKPVRATISCTSVVRCCHSPSVDIVRLIDPVRRQQSLKAPSHDDLLANFDAMKLVNEEGSRLVDTNLVSTN